MSEKHPQVAIAFYRTKIEFYERQPTGDWSLKHRIDTPSQEETAIGLAFEEQTKKWRDTQREILIWFPRVLSEVYSYETEQAPRNAAERFRRKKSLRDESVAVVSEYVEGAAAPYRFLCLTESDYREAKMFVEGFKLSVIGLARAPESSVSPQPVIFDIKNKLTVEPSAPPKNGKLVTVHRAQAEEHSTNVIHMSPYGEGKLEKAKSFPEIETRSSQKHEPIKTFWIGLGGIVGIFAILVILVLPKIQRSPNDTQISVPPPNGMEEATSSITGEPGENGASLNVASVPSGKDGAKNPAVKNDTEDFHLDGPFPVIDVELAFRPKGHAEIAALADEKFPDFVYHKPDFKTFARPDDHGSYMEKALAKKIAKPADRDADRVTANANRAEALESMAPQKDFEPLNATEATNGETDLPKYSVSGGSSGQIATSQDALDMQSISLLGIFGRQGKPTALIRSPGGRTVTVSQGDSVDGWQIVAISRSEVIVFKSGSQKRLRVPN